MMEKRAFGVLDDGRGINLYKITNSFGEYVELCDYGAVIHSLCVRDRDGRIGDVVLGCADAAAMQKGSMKGATIGRVANRIEYGKCVIDGKELQLETNRGGHFLHGGSGNYAFRLFEARDITDDGVTFCLRDTGEGGFGNCVDACVRFTFDDAHRLTIHYTMVPEETTILCPTNHAYFNLSDLADIRDDELTLYTHNLAKSGESGVPTGGLTPVAGTPADFTTPRRIGDAMASDLSFFPEGRVGFDHFFVLDREREDNLAAVLKSERTGRVMRTYTDMQSVILFTPGHCTGKPDKSGELKPEYAAVCIECQFVPNAVNVPEFDSPVFRAGEKLDTTTVYEFDTI